MKDYKRKERGETREENCEDARLETTSVFDKRNLYTCEFASTLSDKQKNSDTGDENVAN